MTDHFSRQHKHEATRTFWTAMSIAAVGIFTLAIVCLIQRADQFDHEQMSVTTAWYWEIRS